MTTSPTVTIHDEGCVAPDALYLTRRKFGDCITPHGDCIKVHRGYIYVTWYQGGMDHRQVWLSRKPIGHGEWRHIPFPHRHVMFRHDRSLADAHNAIAIGICPKDDTVHLLYDMHAYTPADFEHDYFNYSVSKKGAAATSDEAWNIDLFHPRRNFLSESVVDRNPEAYWRVTYPGFFATSDGDLVAKWRIGGHTNAHMHLTRYDGDTWGESIAWNDTRGEQTTGFYGSFRIFNERMYACWHRRTKADHEIGYINNRGLYFACCDDGSGLGAWSPAQGESRPIPLTDLEPFKIAEPSEPGQAISTGPSFVVTPSGAFHARVTVAGQARHYFRRTPADELRTEQGIPSGDMYAIGPRVYLIGLENGRPVVKSTEEGTHAWRTELEVAAGRSYYRGVSVLHERSIYYYLLETGDTDRRPIHVLRFDLA